MPGFINNTSTKRHASFRDGLKIAQEANTQQVAQQIESIVFSEREEKERRKVNSEAMYQSSASVPDSLIAFTNEIHKECRITPSQEIELGNKTQEAIRLQQTYDNLRKKLGREPNDEEWCAASGKINMEAIKSAIEDGMEAKDQLVTANLRMVQGVVNLYIRNGLGSQYNAGDLMQEGTMALIRAAEKFEPKRGFRFSTYAMYWIRAAVKRSQILQSRIISVPQRLHETHKKVSKVQKELTKELGRRPTSEELAQEVGITVKQLDRCVDAFDQRCYSLDAELENTLNPNKGDMSGDTLYDVLGKKYEDAEYKQLQRFFIKEDLIDTLHRYLPTHEVEILLLRYGLMDERTEEHGFTGPLTIAEVSRLVGLKPDKVRRMINKSLRQLRHLIAHEWEDYENDLPLNM